MATLTPEDIADLVVAAQRELGKMRITEIATDLQEHVAMSRLLTKKRTTFDSGRAIQFNLLTEADENARNVGLFAVDNVNQKDGAKVGVVQWRHTTTGYAFDRRQVSMNRGDAKVVDFVKLKRFQQLIGLSSLMESNFWDGPTDANDKDTPWGLRNYWLVYNATAGFNGGNHTNFSGGPASVDCDVDARWKNYTFNYSNVTKTDLVRKWRKAAAMCGFRPPVRNVPIPAYGVGGRYGWYTTYDILGELEERLEDQNDNLGKDVASMDGQTVFRRVPVEWVPYLQQNQATADPIIGLDWSVFKVTFLRGEYMREDPPRIAPNQHNVMQSFLDCTYNFVCYDRRRLVLGAKATWH